MDNADSQHRNIATSQHRNIATSQHRNKAIGILAATAIIFTPSVFAFSFSNWFSSDKASQTAQTDQSNQVSQSAPVANVSGSSGAIASSSVLQTQQMQAVHTPKHKHKKHKKHKKHAKKYNKKHYDTRPSGEQSAVSPSAVPVVTSVSSEHKWSVFGGLGWSNYLNSLNNTTFAVSNTETDQLTQDSGGSSVGYTLSFARNYDLSDKTNALQSISIGGTFRYDPATLNGQVYQFQDPNLNNYTYQYQIRPLTQLAESDLLFKTIEKIHTAPFIVVGLGITEASLTYTETAQPGISGGESSGSNWVARPDVAVGAGLLWDIKNKKYFIKTQYLYQYRGNTSVSVSGFNENVPINLNEQSVDVLFGYRFK